MLLKRMRTGLMSSLRVRLVSGDKIEVLPQGEKGESHKGGGQSTRRTQGSQKLPDLNLVAIGH